MRNDPESVAWREKMRTGSHYDPKTKTITQISGKHVELAEHPVRYEELPVDPAESLISVQRQASDHLTSSDKSVATIKHGLVFFLVLTIIGIVIGCIAAVAHL
jgi:hypothetical protein